MADYLNKDDDKLKWKTNSVKELFKTFLFTVNAKNETAEANGITADFYTIDTSDWVIVIPEQNENFLMVKQWRHGENSLSVEFPGGVIDKGETPLQAALRELKEETGCEPEKITKLGQVNPNPALFSNHVHVFLAEGLKSTGTQKLDETEFINYLEIPKSEVFKKMGNEEFCHGIMATALMFYFARKCL